jgi:hypothetical protein
MKSRYEKADPRTRSAPIVLPGEGNCAIDLAMVLICANDLWTRPQRRVFCFPSVRGEGAGTLRCGAKEAIKEFFPRKSLTG